MQKKNLMDYFNFDEGDLNANRNGSLTERQKTRLIAELKSAQLKKTLWAYFLFLMAAVGLALGIGIWFMPDISLWARIIMTIAIFIMWSAWLAVLGMSLLPSASYLELELAKETGRVNIVKVQSYNNTSHTTNTRYDLYIGEDRRFVMDSRIGNVLVQGDVYTVYYVKNSRKIVSAEFVSIAK